MGNFKPRFPRLPKSTGRARGKKGGGKHYPRGKRRQSRPFEELENSYQMRKSSLH